MPPVADSGPRSIALASSAVNPNVGWAVKERASFVDCLLDVSILEDISLSEELCVRWPAFEGEDGDSS